METKEIAKKICETLSEHKAEDILLIDVKGKSESFDYFVVAGGRSSTHAHSLVEFVEEDMEKMGINHLREDGVKEGRWAVIDYGDILVHIFDNESRMFYHLEKVWDTGDNVEKF